MQAIQTGRCTALAAAVAFAMCASTGAFAQDKSKSAEMPSFTKVLLENDKVRVYESTFKPGAVSPSRERKPRASYAVKGGTLERTYPDGRKVKSERKAGEAIWNDRDTYSVKNIGKTTVVLVAVEPK